MTRTARGPPCAGHTYICPFVYVVPLCELLPTVGALFYGAWVTMEAFVFVSTTNPGPRAAVRAIRSLDGIVRANALFGGPPVVAIVQGDDLLALDAVIDRIVELPMVTDTETHVVRCIQDEEDDGAAAVPPGASVMH